jgi:murein DD-endopeptidase MepM/ murein hydrolase activator NlpD
VGWRGALLLLLGLADAAGAEKFCDGGVCIVYEDGAGGDVALSIENPLPVPIRAKLDYPELENFEASPKGGTFFVVPAESTRPVAKLAVIDPTRPRRYRFTWNFKLGAPESHHDETARYRMPFGGTAPRRLSQGANGRFSHRGEYAFDFLMPIGTPVLAAREGKVAWVVDQYDEGGNRKSLSGKANEVIVAHADGTLARYLHLRRGVAAEVGEAVAAGALLGHSGNTGYSSEPHLHFEVYAAGEDDKGKTLPIRFASDDPAGFEPVAGSFYPPQE